jgi:hypothetical protein
MTDRDTRISDATAGRRLLASDMKTRMWYIQCSTNQLKALQGHPLYPDITLKSVSRYHRKERKSHDHSN